MTGTGILSSFLSPPERAAPAVSDRPSMGASESAAPARSETEDTMTDPSTSHTPLPGRRFRRWPALLAALALAAAAQAAAAQEPTPRAVTGLVVDARTGEPIE